MEIKELDVVELKDGRTGTILEIFEKNGIKEYYIEVVGADMELWPTVRIDEINKVTWKYKE